MSKIVLSTILALFYDFRKMSKTSFKMASKLNFRAWKIWKRLVFNTGSFLHVSTQGGYVIAKENIPNNTTREYDNALARILLQTESQRWRFYFQVSP